MFQQKQLARSACFSTRDLYLADLPFLIYTDKIILHTVKPLKWDINEKEMEYSQVQLPLKTRALVFTKVSISHLTVDPELLSMKSAKAKADRSTWLAVDSDDCSIIPTYGISIVGYQVAGFLQQMWLYSSSNSVNCTVCYFQNTVFHLSARPFDEFQLIFRF